MVRPGVRFQIPHAGQAVGGASGQEAAVGTEPGAANCDKVGLETGEHFPAAEIPQARCAAHTHGHDVTTVPTHADTLDDGGMLHREHPQSNLTPIPNSSRVIIAPSNDQVAVGTK